MEEKRQELIEKFKKKKQRLSYSTLKNFTSPVNLINYKLKPYNQSPSMIFGSLCDVLLLTPEKFEENYKIIDKIPESDLQIKFANEVIKAIKGDQLELTDELIKECFDMFYKRGDYKKTYNLLEDYIKGKSLGLDLITNDLFIEAKEVCDNLMQNEDIQSLFSQIEDVQKEVSWKDKGWYFIGYLDMYLQDHIIDLKFSKDSNPDKFERDISNFDYFLQAAMYCKALKEMGISDNPKYSFIVFDKSFNYSIIELGYSYIKYGERKYDYLLSELNRCIKEDSFTCSYNFFKTNNIVHKPNWAKGFPTDKHDI